MTTYPETIEVIDTPLSGHYDPYFEPEPDFWPVDPMRKLRQRVVVLLLAVVAVMGGLSMLVLGGDVSGAGGGGETAVSQANSNALPEAAAPSAEQPAQDAFTQAESQSATAVSGAISPIFTPEVQHWAAHIVRWADEHSLDPNIVATIMQIESCGDPQAVSIAGARGLFQVMPFHFTGGEDMLDPDTNAKRGLLFYNEQLRYTSGDILLSFAGYNGGYAASGSSYDRWANETQRYYKWAKGIYEDAAAGRTTSETLQQWLAAGGAAGCQRAAGRLGLTG